MMCICLGIVRSVAPPSHHKSRITSLSPVENAELPEKVDIIISEPIGFLLVHERMLETYIVARER